MMPWHKKPAEQSQISPEERAKLQARLDELRAELARRQAEGQAEPAQQQPAPPTPEEDAAQRAKLQARLDTLKAELARRQAAERAEAAQKSQPAEGGKLAARLNAEDPFASRARAAAIADEPQAAIIGRMALESGGSAADAAAAMYFALAVTHPAAASLGGGGICLVRSANGRIDSLDFLARAPAAGGAIAVPGNLAGIAALQSHYGVMRWAAVVLPAERLAGAGTVTHALAEDIAKIPASARGDVALDTIARRTTGDPRAEGDSINRPDLAMVLTKISAGGVNLFYDGALGRTFIDAARAKGGAITPGDLKGYTVKIASAEAFDTDGMRVSIPSLATGAGQLAAETLSSARGASERGVIDAAVTRSLSELGAPQTLPQDFGSTSFLAADASGRAVSCAVTMNGAFGAAASSNGIIMAKNPAVAPEGYGNAFLDPMIATNGQGGALHAVASASSGPSSLAGIIEALAVSRASPKRNAHDILSAVTQAGPSGHLYACQSSGDKHSCSAASDPSRAGLASVIVH
ncbi:MAG: gamma-glutamyltransferase [Alphaproteobacteria bacterium]